MVFIEKKINLGDKVRIKSSVAKPEYEWGAVTHASIGVVTSIDTDGEVILDFPQQKKWYGLLVELELVKNVQTGDYIFF